MAVIASLYDFSFEGGGSRSNDSGKKTRQS